ncbi:MAG: thioredoxin-disulfide reductase [Deltaproteobacteria bacterium]|nr:thioredoxin-disulfide reductase [Deltaproteobacteria bacterium]
MYDLIIIGAGPAGLTAGLYAARGRINALLLERFSPGGQVLTTDWVENYPGFPEGISGFELMEKMKTQAEHFGLPIRMEEVIGLELHPEKKVVITHKEHLEAKALILTLGATPKKLGIEGEEPLIGKGVSYCATCDGPFYREQEVAVIGGGDTALEEALFLTRFAGGIHLIHRRDRLRAVKLLQDRAMAEEKIEFIWDTVPIRILGESGVEGIEFKNVKTGEISRKEVQGVFVFIGTQPNSNVINGMVKQDEKGFVMTDEKMETSIPGVFAAGDIRSKALRQVSTAVGDGANAAFFAERFIENME